MFSRRLPCDFPLNELAERALLRKERGAPLIDLTVSNPTRIDLDVPPPPPLRTGDYDPDPAGSHRAREAVAGYYADRGARVAPEEIILTASTSEAYAHLFRLLGDPGDDFLVPAPSYPLFGPLADLEGIVLRPYPLLHDGRWWLDFERFDAALTPRTRGIIVVNPNNPTGSFLDLRESERIERAAADRRAALIVDEVFGDFVLDAPDRRPTFAGSDRGLTFTLSGLSKVCGLPQLKLAWIVVSGEPGLKRRAVNGLHWIADAFLSVGSPVQDALPELLSGRHAFQQSVLARVRDNLEFLRDRAAGSRVSVLVPQAGWSAVLRLPRTRTETEWCVEFLERGVQIHPGHFYDCAGEAWGVVSLLPPETEFRAGAEILFAAVDASP